MPHVADGDLHAYLDGALDLYPADEARRIRDHVDTCAECRRRLEAAMAVREAAASVLERTGPDPVELPPFESIRRRASTLSSEGTVRRGGSGFGGRLAWAASILVALGVGWMAGRAPAGPSRADSLRQEAQFGAEEGGAAEAPRVARTGDVRPDTEGEAPGAPAPDVVASSARPTPGEAELRAVVPGADSTAAAGVGEGAVAVPSVEASRAVALRAADSPTIAVRGAPADADSLANPELRALADPMSEQQARMDSLAVAAERVAGGRGDSLPTGREERIEAANRVDSLRTAEALEIEALRRADSIRTVPSEPRAAEAARRMRDTAVRAEDVGAGRASRPLAIPGLSIVGLEWTEVAPGVDGLRVVQQLAGDTVRLELTIGGLDTPEGTGPPAALLEEALPDGVARVAGRLPGRTGWAVLRGRLPAERLQRLLELIR